MINIDVKDDLLHFNIDLQRRVSFIKGDSATGKTSMYNLLDRKLRHKDDEVLLKSNIDIVLLDFSNLSEKHSHVLYIVDDLDILPNHDFEALMDNMIEDDLWFLIMSREEVDYKLKASIIFSSNCEYSLGVVNGVYTLIPLYIYDNKTIDKYDCVLVEDAKGGFEFFSKLYSNCEVRSACGKNNVITCMNTAIEDGFENILVIFDTANFGSCFSEFYNTATKSEANIEFISAYECFEELLLQTNLLRHLEEVDFAFQNLESEANKFKSWEKYFEYLISVATSNKPYGYSHGKKLTHCYIDDCSSCNRYVKEKCDYINKDYEKLNGLLKDTKYSFLLD